MPTGEGISKLSCLSDPTMCATWIRNLFVGDLQVGTRIERDKARRARGDQRRHPPPRIESPGTIRAGRDGKRDLADKGDDTEAGYAISPISIPLAAQKSSSTCSVICVQAQFASNDSATAFASSLLFGG